MSGSLLVTAVQEIVRRLNDGDWVEFETDGGEPYYIVGHDAWMNDNAGMVGGRPSTKLRRRWTPSSLGDYTVRSGVAGATPAEEYLERARRRLENIGISGEQIDLFLAGDVSGFPYWELGAFGGERWEEFMTFVEAVVLVKTVQEARVLDSEDREIIERDLERIFLLELARKYPKIVNRASRLAPLSFQDAQLEEASRCYLYGFWRATITLSATALDSALASRVNPAELKKTEEEQEEGGHFRALVSTAADAGLLGKRPRMGEEPQFAFSARFVFDKRNSVVHKQNLPDENLAFEVSDAARRVIEHLVDNDSNRSRE